MPEVSGSGGGITISAEVYRATIDNALVEDLSDYFIAGEIEMNVDRDIKLAARIALREPSRVTPYTDYLAPFIRIEYDDETTEVYRQCGLYAVPVAPQRLTYNDAVGEFDGRDLTWVMATSAYADTNNVTSGQNYVSGATGISEAITGAGVTRYNVPTTSSTFASAQSFPPGTTRLEKANTLLSQLGWYNLGMDLDGRVSTPGAPQNLASQEPWRTLTDDDLIAPPEVQPAGQEIANVVIVVNDNAGAAPLTATARNDDAGSPTSTVVVGRDIVRVERVSGDSTQAALNALAARLLAESRTYYQTVRLRLLHDPSALIPHQTVGLNLPGTMAALNGHWWIRTAKLGLTPGSPLELECNRVTDNTTGAVI